MPLSIVPRRPPVILLSQVMRLPKHQARLLFGTSAVDKAMTAWLEICDSIVHQSHVSLAMGQAAIARLFTIFDEVMAGLDQSFMVYKVLDSVLCTGKQPDLRRTVPRRIFLFFSCSEKGPIPTVNFSFPLLFAWAAGSLHRSCHKLMSG